MNYKDNQLIPQDHNHHALSLDQRQKLKTIQTQALRRYAMIDLGDTVIPLAWELAQRSPYRNPDNLLTLAGGFIDVFYAVRRQLSACPYDDELMATIYQKYLDNYGVFDPQLNAAVRHVYAQH